MSNSAYIQDELKQIAPHLAAMEKANIFTVPENYFSDLAGKIQERIKTDNPFTFPSSKPKSLDVPSGYFDNLAGNILQKIKQQEKNSAEENDEFSEILNSAKNKNVFTIPEGYFDRLPQIIVSHVKPQAKVVVMKKRNMVWQSAAAAVVLGILSITALWMNNYSKGNNSAVASMNKIYINDGLQYKTEQQVNEAIASLPEKDIIQYLEETGTSADDEAVVSGIQEQDLPAEMDYLTNENTLQDFLSNTPIKNTQN